MKKQLLAFGATAIALTSLAGFASASAEEPTTTDTDTSPVIRSFAGTDASPDSAMVMGKGMGMGHHGPRGMKGVDSAALATFLGVSEDDLKADLSAGSSLATVASDAGKTRDELKAFLTTSVATSLAEKVAAGTITQEEADTRLAKFSENLDNMIDNVRPAGVPGGPGGHPHGPRPANGITTDDATAPAATTTTSSTTGSFAIVS